MNQYSFHPAARAELEHAIEYYEVKRSGLGAEFAEEVYSAIHRILQSPEAWSRLSLSTRRCLTHRFPYGIVYQIANDEVWIIAVMHLNRRPDYYRNRLG